LTALDVTNPYEIESMAKEGGTAGVEVVFNNLNPYQFFAGSLSP
jgi:hypothetical protein